MSSLERIEAVLVLMSRRVPRVSSPVWIKVGSPVSSD